MYISKGTDVNAAWTNAVAVSYNGAVWKSIAAGNITVQPSVTTDRDKKQKFKITLLDGLDDIERFFLEDVVNQPTWTNDLSGLTQSVLDITTWVAASIGGSDTALLTNILNELVAINGKVATETTLTQAKDLLTLLESKDFSTETTLQSLKVAVETRDLLSEILEVQLNTNKILKKIYNHH